MFKLIPFSLFLYAILFSALSAREININTLALKAAQEDKHLLVWLHKTDCGYCESMREFTLEDDRIAASLKKSFLLIQINVSEKDDVIYGEFKGTGKEFAKNVGYNFYPSSLFFDADAKMIFAAAGYIEENDFAVMLNYIESGAYRKTRYDIYRQKRGQ